MSNFKDMLEEDIDIFLNIDEFGEELDIDGEKFIGIIEHIERDYRDQDTILSMNAIAVVLYLYDKKELRKYKKGKAITVNNTTYILNNSYVENGMRIMKLEENSGY
ncbi:hypothetical protein IX317_001847 [Fusobacterium sp. DD29]|uniref:hypothetical protein n=1 Tax=unclassified Fusobacterium TaxID=2648384 RepID=UPI001B8B5849|nr:MULTISPECIES: hypothetical protein [unclassified Fusobacterium]MBR8701155.1 hypothetical protein [Fusobacterium sp. DD45]MBR8711332.1 hypothetical protein [Fusobacterium sp. DD28]MBR8750163.1 hypothetical protein [Fusobacterium sp. DD29]MBR8751881.1 hypothetical protein [Fusobacterium sp. DD26]MBR8762405.1 hypothetical protein [Fusobacterium sp. DD25]